MFCPDLSAFTPLSLLWTVYEGCSNQMGRTGTGGEDLGFFLLFTCSFGLLICH